MEACGVATGMYDVPGWNAHLLNKQMLEVSCANTAKLIETNPFYRWSEENKQSLSIVAESITDFTYALTLYNSTMASRNQVCRQNNLAQKSISKLKDALRKIVDNRTKVTLKGGTPTSKPNQVHHYATDKRKTYTQAFKDITDKYGLDLDADWNKELLPHQGRHPNAYHDFVLDEMRNIDNIANGNKDILLRFI